MRHSRLLTLGVAGVCASLVMGVVTARTSDSVTSQGNSIQSDVYVMPHKIQAAVVAVTAADCSGAAYGDGPIAAVLPSADLQTPGMICIKNAGPATGAVYATFTNVADTEVGPCNAAESSPTEGNDATCGDGDAGELKAALVVTMWNYCTSTSRFAPLMDSLGPYSVQASLAPGQECRVMFSSGWSGSATDQQKSTAQTDKVTFDVVFTLQDA